MKRRSFLSLLAAAFASPLIGQLDGFSIPSTGPVGITVPCGITVPWNWEAVEALPTSWVADIEWCAAGLADRIDQREAEYAYRSFDDV